MKTTDRRPELTSKDIDNQFQPIGHLADLVETGNDPNWDPLITIHLR